MEYFYRNGRELPESLLTMIPEAWGEQTGLSPELKAFYEYSTAQFSAPRSVLISPLCARKRKG